MSCKQLDSGNWCSMEQLKPVVQAGLGVSMWVIEATGLDEIVGRQCVEKGTVGRTLGKQLFRGWLKRS